MDGFKHRSGRWLLAALLLWAAPVCRGETLTFAGIAIPGDPVHPVDSYGGFTFSEFYGGSLPPLPFPQDGTGYIYVGDYPFEPPPYASYLPDETGSLYSLSYKGNFYVPQGQTFTLNSLLITSEEAYPGSIDRILGYRDKVLLYSALTSAADPETGLLTLNWTGVDGIVLADSFPNYDAIDNIRVNEPVGSSPVPEPASVVFVATGLMGAAASWRRRQKARRAI